MKQCANLSLTTKHVCRRHATVCRRHATVCRRHATVCSGRRSWSPIYREPRVSQRSPSVPEVAHNRALTPSLSQPVHFRAERCMDTPANSRFSGPITSTFNALPVWKIRQTGFRISDLALWWVIFKCHHGSEGINYDALPGASSYVFSAFPIVSTSFFFFFFNTSLSLVGKSCHLSRVRHSRRRSSATNSCWCVPYNLDDPFGLLRSGVCDDCTWGYFTCNLMTLSLMWPSCMGDWLTQIWPSWMTGLPKYGLHGWLARPDMTFMTDWLAQICPSWLTGSPWYDTHGWLARPGVTFMADWLALIFIADWLSLVWPSWLTGLK